MLPLGMPPHSWILGSHQHLIRALADPRWLRGSRPGWGQWSVLSCIWPQGSSLTTPPPLQGALHTNPSLFLIHSQGWAQDVSHKVVSHPSILSQRLFRWMRILRISSTTTSSRDDSAMTVMSVHVPHCGRGSRGYWPGGQPQALLLAALLMSGHDTYVLKK